MVVHIERQKALTIDENIKKINAMILGNRRLKLYVETEAVGILETKNNLLNYFPRSNLTYFELRSRYLTDLTTKFNY